MNNSNLKIANNYVYSCHKLDFPQNLLFGMDFNSNLGRYVICISFQLTLLGFESLIAYFIQKFLKPTNKYISTRIIYFSKITQKLKFDKIK